MHTPQTKSNNWEDFKARLEALKTSIDPRYLLESLGFKILRETPKELRCSCLIHGGDNPTSFRFNKETLTWVCFSRRCHELNGGDILGLIRSVLKVDFMGAVKHLQSLVGSLIDSTSYVEYKRKKEKEAFMRLVNKPKKTIDAFVNEKFLADHIGMRTNYFLKEGYSNEVLNFFEVAGGYVDSHGIVREIIPIRDELDNLVAYSLRDTSIIEGDNKYILTPGFDKDKVLYNLNNVRKHCMDDWRPIIIVEGFKSVWRLAQYGISKIVAVMGSHLTSGQISLLCAHGFRSAVIMFDNDLAGALGTIKACEALEGKMDVFPTYITETDMNGKGLDPSDLSYEQAHEYLKYYI
jgi:DNA primase